MSKMLICTMLAAALALAGCTSGAPSHDYERTSDAQSAAACDAFRDAALRDALQLNPNTAATFKDQLDAASMPGGEPVAVPAAPTAPVEPAPAAPETPAPEAPAPEAPAPEAAEAPAPEAAAPEAPAAEVEAEGEATGDEPQADDEM